MTTAIIEQTKITRVYDVIVDGKRYKVVHDSRSAIPWTAPTSYHGPSNETAPEWTKGYEAWRVQSPVGIHYGVKDCDPDKPTYKRVVAAVKAALAGAKEEIAA